LKTHPRDKFTEDHIKNCESSIGYHTGLIKQFTKSIEEAKTILQILEALE